jgi:hypothetical protein
MSFFSWERGLIVVPAAGTAERVLWAINQNYSDTVSSSGVSMR